MTQRSDTARAAYATVLAAVAVVVGSGCWAAAASADVYWTNNDTGGVGRANLDGSDPTTVASPFIPSADTDRPEGIAVDGQYVYWADYTSGGIGRANLDGSDPTTLASPFIPSADAESPVAVTVDGQYIYWANHNGGIGRANLDGSDPTTAASPFIPSADTSDPSGVAVDGQHIYWTEEFGGIGRANLDGSDPTTVASPFIPSADTSEPSGVAVDGRYIYWANYNGGGIGRANLDGSDPTTVTSPFIPSADASDPSGLAVDGRYIYWTNNGGGIGRANLDGSDPTTAANPFIPGANTSLPAGVAVDAGPAGAATPSASSLTFASQPLDTDSTPQTLTVTDNGHGELQIGNAQVSSGDVDDFLISHDTCSGATLWTGDTCAVDVRFGPTATSDTNARSATLTLTSNDPTSPLSITLQGTGGTLPQGPPGTNGKTGPRGPAGEIELVTCKPVTKGKGKHKKTTQKCSTKLTSKPVKFKTAADVNSAVLSRGDVLYATGSATRAGKNTKLLLTPLRKIRDGSYTLKLTHGRDHQRETITIR